MEKFIILTHSRDEWDTPLMIVSVNGTAKRIIRFHFLHLVPVTEVKCQLKITSLSVTFHPRSATKGNNRHEEHVLALYLPNDFIV